MHGPPMGGHRLPAWCWPLMWLALLQAVPVAASQSADPQQLARGEYLYRVAGCEYCHTDSDGGGPVLAGGRALATPFGIFYSPNISPDPATGIGEWSEPDLRRALRQGMAPDGSRYYPAFPYPSYTAMTDQDIADLYAYLRQLPAVRQEDRPHRLPFYLQRWMMAAWNALFLRPGPWRDDAARSDEYNRGAYLANAVGHCGECHTPRNWFGALDPERRFGGNPRGPDGESVPNITPAPRDGIGDWTREDLEYFFVTGALPDGDYTGSVMSEVIDNSLSHLREADRRALASYLQNLPPVYNPPD